MDVTVSYDWGRNSFWRDITARLDATQKALVRAPLSFDAARQAWAQPSRRDHVSEVALLQNRFVVIDVTDRGFGIYPLLLGGRYVGRLGFRVDDGTDIWDTHWCEDAVDTDVVLDRRLLFEPGRAILVGRTRAACRFELGMSLLPSSPVLRLDLALADIARGRDMVITPEVLWMPGDIDTSSASYPVWLRPRVVDLADPVVAKNNSTLADPLRPADINVASLGIAVLGAPVLSGATRRCPVPDGGVPRVLCDRVVAPREIERLTLPPIVVRPCDGQARVALALGIYASAADAAMLADDCPQAGQGESSDTGDYWLGVASRLSVACPDDAIARQARYSVHNSLFSRSVTDEDRTIFIHGRRDRGYEDCAKVHQSYQMHIAALAAGETAEVKQELLAYAALQDGRGDVARQLRPGHGAHPYAGLYSNAHFIMALHRYLSWTGDTAAFEEPVENRISSERATLGARAMRAADWLLENRWSGVVAPCGWLDAWPPDVKAQGQMSIAAHMALRDMAAICAHLGLHDEADRYGREARALAGRTRDVFYSPRTGLFGEHLFAPDRVAGNEPTDFWAHTQVWAALAGLAPDARGLDLCWERCMDVGMRIIPPSTLGADYVARSTDGADDLSLDSTVTWLLASWPELTHLYALAEIRHGRPDRALEAVSRQLPEHIHARNPRVAPFYYAEKYLSPEATPWLCTWGGDPTLLQVMLEGFGGLTVGLDGLTVRPCLPRAWSGARPLRARFQWRGEAWRLTVDGVGSRVVSIALDGRPVGTDTTFVPNRVPDRAPRALTVTVAE